MEHQGYKAEIKNNKVTKYDFRVNIVKEKLNIDTPLSHVNIIVDLYNKVQKDNSLYNDLRIFLHNLSLDNDLDPFRNTKLLEYPYENIINIEVINLIENVHRRLGKKYIHCPSWCTNSAPVYIGAVYIYPN
jgi:hypothetical protein